MLWDGFDGCGVQQMAVSVRWTTQRECVAWAAERSGGIRCAGEQERGKAVTERLLEALNVHDLEGQLACFSEDYRSEQAAHPARAFSGREQVRENWSKLYECIPDFRAELLRLAVAGEAEWGEWIWRGTKEDGT